MLEWYFKNIRYPWLKLSFPLLAVLDCILKNVEEIADIEIPLQRNTAIAIAGFIWVLSGTFYLGSLAFVEWLKNNRKETHVYLLLILTIVAALTLTPVSDYPF